LRNFANVSRLQAIFSYFNLEGRFELSVDTVHCCD